MDAELPETAARVVRRGEAVGAEDVVRTAEKCGRLHSDVGGEQHRQGAQRGRPRQPVAERGSPVFPFRQGFRGDQEDGCHRGEGHDEHQRGLDDRTRTHLRDKVADELREARIRADQQRQEDHQHQPGQQHRPEDPSALPAGARSAAEQPRHRAERFERHGENVVRRAVHSPLADDGERCRGCRSRRAQSEQPLGRSQGSDREQGNRHQRPRGLPPASRLGRPFLPAAQFRARQERCSRDQQGQHPADPGPVHRHDDRPGDRDRQRGQFRAAGHRGLSPFEQRPRPRLPDDPHQPGRNGMGGVILCLLGHEPSLRDSKYVCLKWPRRDSTISQERPAGRGRGGP